MSNAGGPLEGIRVVDVSRVLAGPFCTMILGDLGAEVIKVEAPGGSDETRGWGPPYAAGESAYYLCANRNKRGLTLDLKKEEGKRIFLRLIREADVLVENFKVGTLARMGLAPERLRKINPRLVVAEITGFGQTGPLASFPGYDFIIQALGGLMSITGSEESGPMKVGVAIVDVLAGLYAALGILAALHERKRSGEGQVVDTALLDVCVASLVNVASNYLVGGKVAKRLGNAHPNIVPYQSFRAADQEMAIAVGNDRQFRRLAEVMGKPELAEDGRFATNRDRLSRRKELTEALQRVFETRPAREWMELLQGAGIPCAPIQSIDQVFGHPQVRAREMVVEMPHPSAEKVRLVGSPLKLSRTPVTYRRHPPLAGEHTQEILTELGYSEEEIEKLRREGVI
jgi:crotonobetainyl-CoA:carnitine CoA-transferase CaiB-like acyl-CoA transferase